ncbi:acyl-CoA dehydrogenase family protein [Aureimonas leprariae]|uniref:Acyl-CoA dehydrogenase n=1 Tax=Plantimonas leprariae TaxID=2615207 RepID=A0A7V7PLJ8_9HYPH|nr:acyl-CoA dehydrogenase family protein [Aureimonas leprariae]KAB0677342.1 acyl-CoA dehydrogenase [Aureimonas leprariae]
MDTLVSPTAPEAERHRAASPLAAAEALRPLIQAHRAELAAGPDIPNPIAGAMIEAGLAQLWLPHSLGGLETHPLDFVETIEFLARIDGSVAWCASISSGMSRFAKLFDTEAMRLLVPTGKMFAGSGSGKPSGAAVREGDGWRIGGRWSWASFCRHSSVSALMCVEVADGVPRVGADGRPVLRGVFLPSDKVEIADDWNAGGLKASGSHDVLCTGIRVPDEYTVDGADLMQPRGGDPLYGLPMTSAAAIAAIGIPLGLAAASIEALVGLAQAKTPFAAEATLRMREDVQSDVARAMTHLEAARALAFDAVGELWREATSGRPVSIERQAALRRACWNAGDVGRRVARRMYELAGATAVLESAPFAARLRDVEAACQHIGFQERMLLPPGRILLGLEPNAAFI